MGSRNLGRFGEGRFGVQRFAAPEPLLLKVFKVAPRKVLLNFDGVLRAASQLNPGGDSPTDPKQYAVVPVSAGAQPVSVSGASLLSDGQVELLTGDMTIAQNYKLSVLGNVQTQDDASTRGLEADLISAQGDRPTLTQVVPTSANEVRATFSEAVKENSALLDPGEYRFEGPTTLTPVGVSKSGEAQVDIITAEQQLEGQLYTLFVGEEVADSALPLLKYVNSTRVEIRRRFFLEARGESSKYTLQDGKTRLLTSVLVDFTNPVGAGGLESGTPNTSTFYYIYLIPDPLDDDQLAGIFSPNPPLTGPTITSNYQYVGHIFRDVFDNIRRFVHHPNDASFIYLNKDEALLEWYTGGVGTGNINPPTGTWYSADQGGLPGGIGNVWNPISTIVAAPVVDEVRLSLGTDADPGSDHVLMLETESNMYGQGTFPTAIARGVDASFDEQRNSSREWIPLNDSGTFYVRWGNASDVMQWVFLVTGVKDKYLR